MIDVPRILCPVDFSDISRRALAYAASTARWYDAALTVLHVVPELVPVDVLPPLAVQDGGLAHGVVALDRPALQGAAEAFAAGATSGTGVTARVLVREEPDVAQAILDEVSESETSLVVMGTHGRGGLEHLLLGSVAEQVLRHAKVPVMIVPRQARAAVPAGAIDFDSIVCGVDFSEASRRAARWGVSLAEESDGRLALVHVLTTPPEAQLHDPGLSDPQAHAAAVATSLEELRSLVPPEVRPYLRPETLVEEGDAARTILGLAESHAADLIVLGVQNRGGLDRLLRGSVTHDILRGAQVPVLTVPAT